jgi:hypothetical protein
MERAQTISGCPGYFTFSWVKNNVTYLMMVLCPDVEVGHQSIPLIVAAT